MSQNDVFTAEKQLFSRICHQRQSYQYGWVFLWFLLDFRITFWVFFHTFWPSFFNRFLGSFWGRFLGSFWTLFLDPKLRKTRAEPESVPGPSRGRFWGHFWSILGVILGPFFEHFGMIFKHFPQTRANTCRHVRISGNPCRYMQIYINSCRIYVQTCVQMHANTRRYAQIRAKSF